MVPPRCICFGYFIASYPPISPIRIPGYRPSCSCSFTSLIGGLLCLQAVTPTSYGYSHSHSGLSPFLLMFVHFPHRRSALPASSHANLLWVSVMRQNQSCYKYQNSQTLQNNPSVSRHGGSVPRCRPPSAEALRISAYRCNCNPWQNRVRRYRG